MLVLSRKVGQQIRIGQDVQVIVLSIKRGRVKLGVTAPSEARVHRGELLEKVLEVSETGVAKSA
jgi:carbon storage regulator